VKLAWLPLALDDLEHLRSYIAADAPGAAGVVADRILNAIETLAEFPERGRPGRVPGTRELVVPRTPFLVAYRLREYTIEVLRILHGARRWPAL
jgi:toxin ParE1/3/4